MAVISQAWGIKVKSLRRNAVVLACTGAALVSVQALAQRPQPSPEQRIERLEKQLQQVQRQVFPRGRPADTAGFSDEPAATQSSVTTLDQRLDSLERQMSDLIRQSEENGHRLQTMESDLAKSRSDQDQRIATLEQRVSDAAAASAVPTQGPSPTTIPPPRAAPTKSVAIKAPQTAAPATDEAAADAGEIAYTDAFHLWESGQFDQAISSLKAFTSAYPGHRRVSYANNLIGRSLIEKGQLEKAAAVLLANYRSNPQGERAADSLYYLGQAEMKLGQPGQACKAYAELDAVYGAKTRADLKKLLTDAKTQAQCS